MIFVDTGYWLALCHRSDSLHQRAMSWSQSLTEPLVTTEFVIWETVNGLSKPPDRAQAHRIVDRIRQSENWSVVPAKTELFEAGLQLHRGRPDKGWSLTDCASFVTMDQLGIRLGIRQALTPDHHFEQAGYEALLRRDPE